MADNSTGGSSRRRFLSTTATTGAVFGLGGIARGRQQVATSYALGGVTSGWRGRRPESIADAVNPTLRLEAGKKYEVTWENVDGAPHNFAVLSQNGDVMVRTEIISQGSQTVTFTAKESMAEYLCQVHPSSMQGPVQFGGGGQTTQTAQNQTTRAQGTTQNQLASNQTTATPTQNQTTTAGPGTTTEQIPQPPEGALGEGPQKYIARLAPAQGIQSDAKGTTYFTLHPPNGVRAKLMYALYVQNVNDVTAAYLRLNRPGRDDPIVARLFDTTNPVDHVEGTLVDAVLTAYDLEGPFEGRPLVPLIQAIRSGNVYVEVQTEQYPDGLLRGPVRPLGGARTRTTRRTTLSPGTTERNQTTAANDIGASEVAQRARAPGFGVLTTLGGLAGAAGYLLNRGDD
ncbi:CHRD domain-containing protein [Halorussus limi]|uniref:CHRD domain-containing protein n=1 Tax=Halorussus limi TaxID=2938695 RepID=A0A8U0HY17_9EURY|nr:CHRD domain-containing protein [Halorussus limi]UPV75536.1 CHRD domain-containing protein [Halorussus limi]